MREKLHWLIHRRTVQFRYHVHGYKRVTRSETEIGADRMRAGQQIKAPDAVHKPWLLEQTICGGSRIGDAGPGGVGQSSFISYHVMTKWADSKEHIEKRW